MCRKKKTATPALQSRRISFTLRRMEILTILGIVLGFATLAGINLYLTVFVTGVALHFQWVALPEVAEKLTVLGNPWIIAVSGILYFLQFFADKIPWVDSLNDTVHTIIRPVGAMLLAVLALGEAHPVIEVVTALLAGTVALAVHASKAGARLLVNTSPEPFSNVAASVGEDAIVLGGLGLMWWHPVVAAIVVMIFLVAVVAILPWIFRRVFRLVRWFWQRLKPQVKTIVADMPNYCKEPSTSQDDNAENPQ